VQSSATPTIERLGLAPLLEAKGAVHNSIDVWTRYGGWIVAADDAPFGYSVTRRRLDPLLRELAADTPGVDLLNGWSVTGLSGGARPTGVTIESSSGARREIAARLTVGADGRDSTVARLARVPARSRPNRRFFYWAYWSGMEPAGPRSRMWLLEPDCAYTFPTRAV
jgi:2-polyprenyl-6-methoxyphenol hydroxylase-like FAD-dependent oxidoreductase